MQNFNFHGHTYRCGHADLDYSDEDYIKEAIKNNLKYICFTDHAPNSVDKRKNMRMKYSEKDEYLESIENLKKKYQDKITVYKGFEVEYTWNNEKELLDFKNETDLLILGQHFIVSNGEVKVSNYEKYSDDDIDNYINTIKKALSLGVISILAHPDFVMLARNNFGEKESYMVHEICKACEKYDVVLEINLNKIFAKTYFNYDKKKLKSYKKPSYYFDKLDNIKYPSRKFWKIVSSYNVKVVYGIDSHFKGQISLFEELVEIANYIIGKDIVKELHFCDISDIKMKI